jgi:hypothetical protein
MKLFCFSKEKFQNNNGPYFYRAVTRGQTETLNIVSVAHLRYYGPYFIELSQEDRQRPWFELQKFMYKILCGELTDYSFYLKIIIVLMLNYRGFTRRIPVSTGG